MKWMNRGCYLADNGSRTRCWRIKPRIRWAGFRRTAFLHAVTLADLGRIDEAAPIFQTVFRANPDWAEMVKRLPAAGLMKDDPAVMQQILAQLHS